MEQVQSRQTDITGVVEMNILQRKKKVCLLALGSAG
jgi:hypothetical protein